MMETSTLIMAALGLILGIVWMAWPLFSSVGDDVATEIERDRLLTLYEQVMGMIRDLDEDHSTGKLNDDDYQVDREAWAERGVKILAALQAMPDVSAGPETAADRQRRKKARKAAASNPADYQPTEQDIDAAIEAAIAKAARAKS